MVIKLKLPKYLQFNRWIEKTAAKQFHCSDVPLAEYYKLDQIRTFFPRGQEALNFIANSKLVHALWINDDILVHPEGFFKYQAAKNRGSFTKKFKQQSEALDSNKAVHTG